MSRSSHPSQSLQTNPPRGVSNHNPATHGTAHPTRFNPMRGVSQSNNVVPTPRNLNGSTPAINPNMFSQDEIMHRTIHEPAMFNEFDEEPITDDDNLYDAWPPLANGGIVLPPSEDLERLVVLDNDHVQLVRRMLQTGPEGRWRACLILMASILNRLGPASEAMSPEISLSTIVNPPRHIFSSTIKGFLRRKIHELLTVANLEAYSRSQTVGGIPLNQTPLVMLNAYLEAQPEKFKREHLPVDWPRNHLSSQSVFGLMRLLLKHERRSLRNSLLTNVKSFNRRSIDGPVPSLMELILIIDRAMGARDELRSPESVAQAYNTVAKVRIAYIRLETIHHYVNPDPTTNLTQWDIIDQKLEALRRQSDNYRNAFARLIVDTDRGLFGEVNFRLIPKAAFVIPTHEEVQQEMDRAAEVQNRIPAQQGDNLLAVMQ